MAIQVTRSEVLSLMNSLRADHFLQDRLAEEMIRLNHTSSNDTNRFNLAATDTEPAPIFVRIEAETHVECKYSFYGHPCREVAANDFCEEHLGIECSYRDEVGSICRKQIDHGCPVELQFVCGSPLCPDHRTCKTH